MTTITVTTTPHLVVVTRETSLFMSPKVKDSKVLAEWAEDAISMLFHGADGIEVDRMTFPATEAGYRDAVLAVKVGVRS